MARFISKMEDDQDNTIIAQVSTRTLFDKIENGWVYFRHNDLQ